MKFYKDGAVFKAVNISGPTHNYLGLSFATNRAEELSIDAISLPNDGSRRLDIDRVREWVMRGVIHANQRLSTSYQLKLIQFVVSDSPPESNYFDMAVGIVERMHDHAGFDGESRP